MFSKETTLTISYTIAYGNKLLSLRATEPNEHHHQKSGRYAMPLVTKCFSPNLFLGKQRISLWVASILRICLCSQS